MKIELRLEEAQDYRLVEELTREAFWNVHVPGCNEHLLIHNLRNTKEFVKDLDFAALYGGLAYYKRFGFKVSQEYHITDKDKKYPAALLVLELYPNALNGIEGIFDEGKIYEIGEKELEEFEKSFKTKEKGFAKTQERFQELVNTYNVEGRV